MALWETKNNPQFDLKKVERLKVETESNDSTSTIWKWVEQTSAIGIISLQGKYGGTYAAPSIATDFTLASTGKTV